MTIGYFFFFFMKDILLHSAFRVFVRFRIRSHLIVLGPCFKVAHILTSWLPKSCFQKHHCQISCFNKTEGKKNQNLPENCSSTLQSIKQKEHTQRDFFSDTKMHLSLFFLSYLCLPYVGATYLPYSRNFFFSPGGRHGLVGLWPFKLFFFFSFQELHQCFFVCYWIIPTATENWLV